MAATHARAETAQTWASRIGVMVRMTDYLFLIFAQESRSVTVRLNTRAPGSRVDDVADEVRGPLELIPRSGRIIRHARLDLRAADDDERVRIERIDEILPVAHGVGIGNGEQRVVQPELAVERVRGRHPVNRALHFSAVGRVAAARCRIVGASELDDLARRDPSRRRCT